MPRVEYPEKPLHLNANTLHIILFNMPHFGDGFIIYRAKSNKGFYFTREYISISNEYLSNYYWKEPSPKRAKQARKSKFDARTWYLEKRWALILERSLECVYLIRCQLIHGAATHGGKLNRTSLKHCSMMLNCLLPTFLMVYVENGSEEEWGTLCYPPSNGSLS